MENKYNKTCYTVILDKYSEANKRHIKPYFISSSDEMCMMIIEYSETLLINTLFGWQKLLHNCLITLQLGNGWLAETLAETLSSM